jgi:hypothetical protein
LNFEPSFRPNLPLENSRLPIGGINDRHANHHKTAGDNRNQWKCSKPEMAFAFFSIQTNRDCQGIGNGKVPEVIQHLPPIDIR